MQRTDVRRRVKRLERLAMGLARESNIIGKGEDPLLYRERKQYLQVSRTREDKQRQLPNPQPPASTI
jgi:hypothetical protein